MSSYKLVFSDRSEKTRSGCIDDDEVNIVQNLEEKVSAYMSQGWTCIGTVVIICQTNGLTTRMYQAMIKTV